MERLAAGATAGDYVIERFVGAGAMGEVYAGSHPVIGKKVAIKVLRPELATSAEAAERFLREARAVNQVEHPNVIDVFGCGRIADGRLYLAMDLVAGQSLRARLAGGALPLPEALAILDQIAAALDAAHARGVIHRDLKPDNIMLAEDGSVRVLDFGIAKLVSGAQPGAPGTLTGQGSWLGTPAYMAPEQWSADGAGPASDRYALGVIAFELLTGQLPFAAQSVPAMMEQHFRTPVPPLSARGSSAPAALDGVLRRALAKDPAERYPSARELVDALVAAAGTRGFDRKRLWAPGVAGVGVLAIGVVAAFAMRTGGDAPAISLEGPPPGTVTIEIASVPDHAQVIAGDRLIGTTPAHLYLAPGESKPVVVRKPGYTAERRTLVAAGSDGHAEFHLDEVSGFAGVWRLASGELRGFERAGEQVDVYKLDQVAGPRHFYRHYPFVAADRGVAFGLDEDVTDPRAPDDPGCHVTAHVEYQFEPEADALVLRREKVAIDFTAGHCVVRSREVEQTPLVRVDSAHDAHELTPPVGDVKSRDLMKKQTKSKMVRVIPTAKRAPDNTASQAPQQSSEESQAQQLLPGRKN